MAWAGSRRTPGTVMIHQVMNPVIYVDVDRGRATSNAYVQSYVSSNDPLILICGRFNYTWSYRDGKWRIDNRHSPRDITETTASA
jgi:hypothetical protein